MPEYIPDTPIPGLDTFDTRGIATAPLPAGEVRRLGDRRRARRRTAVTVACAAVVAAAVIPVTLLTHDGGASRPARGPATQVPTPTPRTITYPAPGVEVVSADDVSKLTGASADFKAFIATQAAAAAKDGAQCPGAAHGITVMSYSTGGYASGGYNACGGYRTVWAKYDGTWGEALGYQDAADCDALAFLGIPRSFVDCFDESGVFGMTQADALDPKPGMTKAQAEAVGLTITTDAVAPPCVTTRYTGPVLPAGDATRGLFSPKDGLVQVAMTTNMKTEDRIGLGSTQSKALAAYPNRIEVGDDTWRVPRSGGTSYLIRFTDGRISRFTWALDKADCADYLM